MRGTTGQIFALLFVVILLGILLSAVSALQLQVQQGVGTGPCADYTVSDPPQPSGNWIFDIIFYPVSLGSYMVSILFNPCFPNLGWVYLIIIVPIAVAIIIRLVRG